MSVMFEVFYKSPSDARREGIISESARHFGGRLSFREVAEQIGGPVTLTFEFDGVQQANEAASRLRSEGEHVEGPMEYSN